MPGNRLQRGFYQEYSEQRSREKQDQQLREQYHIPKQRPLYRMVFIDETLPFVESKSLGMARKYIRKHLPQICGLITYASTAENHKGTIYLADGWIKISESKSGGKGWESRPGRTNRDTSKKLLFVRTP